MVADWTGLPEMKKNAKMLGKLTSRNMLLEKLFRHFVKNDWCHESRRVDELLELLVPEERKLFNFDPRTIDWRVLCALNLYGLQKFMFRMDVSLPFSEQRRLITPLNINYF